MRIMLSSFLHALTLITYRWLNEPDPLKLPISIKWVKLGYAAKQAYTPKTVYFPTRGSFTPTKKYKARKKFIIILISIISSTPYYLSCKGHSIKGLYTPKNALSRKTPIPKNPLCPKKPKSQNRPKTGTPLKRPKSAYP
jgi:hypothetical protein